MHVCVTERGFARITSAVPVCVTERGFARFTGQHDPIKCETRSSGRRQKEGRKGADLSAFSQIPIRASA